MEAFYTLPKTNEEGGLSVHVHIQTNMRIYVDKILSYCSADLFFQKLLTIVDFLFCFFNWFGFVLFLVRFYFS